MRLIDPPAPNPCGSCPYRRDVPSGVWEASEYEKLPAYDEETHAQPTGVFLCHQQDGKACAGWVGCHDMQHSLGLRLASGMGLIEDPDAFLDYETRVPLFDSGMEAAEHGLAGIENPDLEARRVIDKLTAKRERRSR